MKKLISLIVISFISSSIWANESAHSSSLEPGMKTADGIPMVLNKETETYDVPEDKMNAVNAAEERAIEIDKNFKITSISQHVEDAAAHYNIEINYPQINGKALTAEAKQFNQTIEKVVEEEVGNFKKNIALDSPHMKTLPEELQKKFFKN